MNFRLYKGVRKFGFGLKKTFQTKNQQKSNYYVSRQAGFGKIVVFLVPFAAVGGAISYMNYDEKFRETVQKYSPALFKNLEETSFLSISKQLQSVSQQIRTVSSSVTGYLGDLTDKTPTKVTSNYEAAEKPPLRPNVNETTIAPKTEGPTVAAEIKKSIELIPSDIEALEKEIEIAASLSLQQYNKAIQILKTFNEDVRKVVDTTVEDFDPGLWTSLKNKTSARDSSIEEAEKIAFNAIQTFDKCEIALSKIASTSNHERVLQVRNKIKLLNNHINEAKEELFKSKDLANLSEKYWKKVQASRNYFIEQIEAIFPGINLAEKKLNVCQEDLDLFILHAISHVLAYQKELQRLQTDGELRLKRAIDANRSADQSLMMSTQLDFFLEKEKRKLAIENHNKFLQIQTNFEKQLRKQLKQQVVAHFDHLNDAIALREAALKRILSEEFDKKFSSEKASYKIQLAQMLGKLHGMDAALQDRLESEKSVHQTQALWAACHALWSAVQASDSNVNWRNKLRPLKREINAVAEFSENDELVSSVLKNLPRIAEGRGIFPEDALRERFLNVESVARKVALVPEKGARLPVYLFSYLQSVFILPIYNSVLKRDKLENKSIDFSDISTYDILNRARYFVERGNLLQAIKYLNVLQGAPRKVVSDWIKEARLLLETQQASNTLMAYAAASFIN